MVNYDDLFFCLVNSTLHQVALYPQASTMQTSTAEVIKDHTDTYDFDPQPTLLFVTQSLTYDPLFDP